MVINLPDTNGDPSQKRALCRENDSNPFGVIKLSTERILTWHEMAVTAAAGNASKQVAIDVLVENLRFLMNGGKVARF